MVFYLWHSNAEEMSGSITARLAPGDKITWMSQKDRLKQQVWGTKIKSKQQNDHFKVQTKSFEETSGHSWIIGHERTRQETGVM